MSAPADRFPFRLLAPVAISCAATLFVDVAPWAIAVMAAGFAARLVYRASGFEPAPSRLWLALSISVPSVATVWLAITAQEGHAGGPALVSVASGLLALALAGPPTAGALSRVVGLSLAQIAGASVLVPGRTMSILGFCYVAVLVPVLVRLASTLVAPRRGDGAPATRRLVAEGSTRRSSVPGALRFLVAAIPLGVWLFIVLPHHEADPADRAGPSASGAGTGGALSGRGSGGGPGESPIDAFVSGAKTRMRLGFVEKVRKNQRPVLLVKVDGGVRGPEPWTLRGPTYDVFTGREWARSATASRPRSAVPDATGWVDIRPAASSVRRHLLRLEDVSGEETHQLFLAPEATAVRLDDRVADRRVGSAPDGMLVALGLLPAGGVYEERAELPDPDRSTLRGRRSDASVAPFPTSVEAPPEAAAYRAIAGRAIAGAVDPAERAERIEHWLRSSFGYTTEMPAVDGSRPVLDFLERIRRGHCEYFASSMTLLLRSLGQPARLAVGFRGGDWLTSMGLWSFRGNHAHAWCEVWFEGRGWVLYDPTPPADAGGDRTSARGDAADEPSTFERLLRFSAEDRRALAATVGRVLAFTLAVLTGTSAAGLWPVLALLALAALVVLGRRRAAARALGAVDHAGQPLGPYGRALELLARAGLARRDAEAAGEFVERVERLRPEVGAPLERLTRLHDAARFGGRAPGEGEVHDAERALADLRTALDPDRAAAAVAAT